MDHRQVIQTTRKVLAALEALNQHQALRVAEMSRLLYLPRTTTVRVLETLRELKYVERRDDDRRYHLTTRVLSLSSGFCQNFGLVQIARPILDALCDELRWPVSLSALSGFARGWYYQDHSFVDSPEFRGCQGKEGVVSIPILREGVLIAILSSRVIRWAIREDWLAAVLAPRLQAAATEIVAAMNVPGGD